MPDDSIFYEVDDTILILARNAQIQIRIQNSADVEDVSMAYSMRLYIPILHQAHVEKLLKRFRKMFPHQMDALLHFYEFYPDQCVPDYLPHTIASFPI